MHILHAAIHYLSSVVRTDTRQFRPKSQSCKNHTNETDYTRRWYQWNRHVRRTNSAYHYIQVKICSIVLVSIGRNEYRYSEATWKYAKTGN